MEVRDHSPTLGHLVDTLALGRSRLTLLGGFRLSVGGDGVALPMSAQRLLAFLAFHDSAVVRSHVAASLRLEVTDSRAAGSLRSVLWRLRRSGHALVLTSSEHLELDPSVAVDLRDNVALAHRVLECSPTEPADADVVSLSSDVLPDWYEDWVLTERERFRQLRLHALESLCTGLTARGSFGPAVQAGLAAVSTEPLRESAQRVLICAYLAEGNVGEAMRQYRGFRQLLRDELHEEPSAAMEDLVTG